MGGLIISQTMYSISFLYTTLDLNVVDASVTARESSEKGKGIPKTTNYPWWSRMHWALPKRVRTALVAAVLTALVATVLVAIATGSAQAAQYTYANDTLISKLQTRSSGYRASINGAVVNLQPFSADGASASVSQETYRPAPYELISFTTAASINQIFTRAYDVHQRCFWNFPHRPGDIGQLRITCKVKY